MAKFEVFIPKNAKIPMDTTLEVEAESWTEALRLGRVKMGEAGNVTDNMLVDVKDDNTVHVTDAGTGHVLRIRPLEGALEPGSTAAAQTPAPAAAASAAPASTRSGIGRSLELTPDATAEFLEEVFEATQDVNDKADPKEAMYFMLDLAIDRLGTDTGSVFQADINGRELSFAAVRGPGADTLLSIKMEMGQGIVGFCAKEGVGLAVSDVARDPRFFSAISEKIGYATRSILCVPMQADGQTFGALELINRKENDLFTEQDLSLASFIANQLAQYLLRNK